MNIFITGGTSGIGAQLAKDYFVEGNTVAVSGRNKDKFLKHFSDNERRLQFYKVDVVDQEEMKKAIDDFSEKKSGVDLVIANAGRSLGKKETWLNFDDARDIIKTNLDGVLNTIEPALDIMKKQGRGQVVLISSTAAFVGLPGSAPYCASKAAVLRLGESLALNYKEFGIDISVICPGFIDTPLTQKNHHPMPFLLSVEAGSKRIRKAINKKKEFYAFPKRNYFLVKALNMIPRWIYYKIMRLKFLNYAKRS